MKPATPISRVKTGVRNLDEVQPGILLIDESSDILALQRTLLENEGYKVSTARSGKEALRVLRSHNEIHLIILDTILEDMSGAEFLRQLDESTPDLSEPVPAVFLGGSAPEVETRALGFILKFPDIDAYLSEIRRFLGPLGQYRPSSVIGAENFLRNSLV